MGEPGEGGRGSEDTESEDSGSVSMTPLSLLSPCLRPCTHESRAHGTTFSCSETECGDTRATLHTLSNGRSVFQSEVVAKEHPDDEPAVANGVARSCAGHREGARSHAMRPRGSDRLLL